MFIRSEVEDIFWPGLVQFAMLPREKSRKFMDIVRWSKDHRLIGFVSEYYFTVVPSASLIACA